MDNLEHGWLVSRLFECKGKGEIIGYCDWCDEPIREDDNFVKIDGLIVCQHCNEARYEQLEREDCAVW